MRIAMLGLKGVPLPGGVEKYVEEIGRRLVDRGHEVIVYCLPHYTRSNDRYYRGMRLVSLPSLNTKHLDAMTHTALAAVHIILSREADIAHFHTIGLSVF